MGLILFVCDMSRIGYGNTIFEMLHPVITYHFIRILRIQNSWIFLIITSRVFLILKLILPSLILYF